MSVHERLQELARLEHDWDGRGSEAIPVDTIAAAVALMPRLLAEYGEPSIGPMPDGGLCFAWRSPECNYLEAELSSPYALEWMRQKERGGPIEHWDEQIAHPNS